MRACNLHTDRRFGARWRKTLTHPHFSHGDQKCDSNKDQFDEFEIITARTQAAWTLSQRRMTLRLLAKEWSYIEMANKTRVVIESPVQQRCP